MVPMILRLDVRDRDRKGVRLFFPVILLWIIAFTLLIAVFPFVLVAALVTLRRGPGTRLLLFYPLFFGAVFNLSGFRVDIANRADKKVFISLD